MYNGFGGKNWTQVGFEPTTLGTLALSSTSWSPAGRQVVGSLVMAVFLQVGEGVSPQATTSLPRKHPLHAINQKTPGSRASDLVVTIPAAGRKGSSAAGCRAVALWHLSNSNQLFEQVTGNTEDIPVITVRLSDPIGNDTRIQWKSDIWCDITVRDWSSDCHAHPFLVPPILAQDVDGTAQELMYNRSFLVMNKNNYYGEKFLELLTAVDIHSCLCHHYYTDYY